MALPWKDEYSVGVVSIDNQHKHYVGILNRLYKAIEEMKVKEELSSIFDELAEYANYHFETEEKYFDEFKYEGSIEHKNAHQSFREKIKEIKNQFENDETTLSFNLIDYLENWLLDHLANMDHKYVQCFHDHGLR